MMNIKTSFPVNHSTYIVALLILFCCAGCAASQKNYKADVNSISSLRFLDEYDLPYLLQYNHTWVGGLSGIDYDAKSNQYYIISDERSATSPARFYTASIKLDNYKFDTVYFTRVTSLLQPNGNIFPSLKDDPQHAADPESIRFNPIKNKWVWSSEGDRAVRNNMLIRQDPFVYEINQDGYVNDSFQLPSNMHTQQDNHGPRTNGLFEGLSFDKNYKNFFVSVEEPLYEDGPRATPTGGAPIRINQFDTETKKLVKQYAYWLDPIAKSPNPADGFAVNGVSEILWIGKNRLLVMERSFSTGYTNCTIKIFLADLSHATDVTNINGLGIAKKYTPATKKLILNMDSIGRYIDNVEGITFGPILPNGHRSLIYISDNNFVPVQKTQFLLFEIIP